MVVNQKTLEKHGLKHEKEIIGYTDYDFSEKNLADDYVNDDKHVMETRESVINRVEIVPQPGQPITWYSTTKFPLCDKQNNVIGTVGFSTNIKLNSANMNPMMHMVPVIDYIQGHISEKIEIETLSSICGLLPAKFNERFGRIFGMSCESYIEKTRVNLAEELLLNSEKSHQDICQKCGFDNMEQFSQSFFKFKHISIEEVQHN